MSGGFWLSARSTRCFMPISPSARRIISAAGFRMFQEKYGWETPVRAVCIRAIGLVPKAAPDQYTIFDDPQLRRKREQVQDAVEDIRGRFGKRAITYATLLKDLKMPDDGRDKVKMPGMMYT